MLIVYCKEGRRVEVERAISTKVRRETNVASPPHGDLLSCLDSEGREVAAFKWEEITGYTIEE